MLLRFQCTFSNDRVPVSAQIAGHYYYVEGRLPFFAVRL